MEAEKKSPEEQTNEQVKAETGTCCSDKKEETKTSCCSGESTEKSESCCGGEKGADKTDGCCGDESKDKADAVKSAQKNPGVKFKAPNAATKPKVSPDKVKEMQKLADSKKQADRPKVTHEQKALHNHLKEVGEDGLTHRERIDRELKEQTKKLRYALFGGCALILLIIVIVALFAGGGNKSTASRNSTTRSNAVSRTELVAYSQFMADLNALSTDLERYDDPAEYDKLLEVVIAKAPSKKADAEAKVKEFKGLAGIK